MVLERDVISGRTFSPLYERQRHIHLVSGGGDREVLFCSCVAAVTRRILAVLLMVMETLEGCDVCDIETNGVNVGSRRDGDGDAEVGDCCGDHFLW